MRFRCPHCNEFGHVAKTVRYQEDRLRASFYVRCTNLYCGHIWRMDTEASYTMKKPHFVHDKALLKIPESAYVNREKKAEKASIDPRQTVIADLI